MLSYGKTKNLRRNSKYLDFGRIFTKVVKWKFDIMPYVF